MHHERVVECGLLAGGTAQGGTKLLLAERDRVVGNHGVSRGFGRGIAEGPCTGDATRTGRVAEAGGVVDSSLGGPCFRCRSARSPRARAGGHCLRLSASHLAIRQYLIRLTDPGMRVASA